MNNYYQQTKFLKTAVGLEQLPSDEHYEIALIGRSNAGKSSAMNSITGLKGLARTSKIPGRTQAINVFEIDKLRRLVDLPGYGYAKVPLIIKERWSKLVDVYLQQRESLRGVILAMDIRHPMKELDKKLLQWANVCQLPVHVLLTKCDKLKPNESRKVLKEVSEELSKFADVSVQLFSSLDKTGVEEARMKMNLWYTIESASLLSG